MRLPGLSVVFLVVLATVARGQGSSRLHPASYPEQLSDSLVTVVDLRRACALSDGLLERAKTRAHRELQSAASSERDQANENVIQADQQLQEWESLKISRDTLKAFCTLQGPPSSWSVVGLPTRATVKAASKVNVRYIPDDEKLGVTGADFGFDQGRIVSGLAAFLVNRAAAEVQVAFVERFQKYVCETNRKAIFEATCEVLGEDHLKLHSALLRELQAAVRQDLKSAPRTAPLTVARTPRFTASLARPSLDSSDFTAPQQDFVVAAYFMGTVLDGMLNGADPLRAFMDAPGRDPDAISAGDPGGLVVDALTRYTNKIRLPVTAGLYRLSLLARTLPDSNLDGNPDWPKTAAGRVEFTKTVIVNLGAWLPELGITSEDKIGRIVATAGEMANQLNQSRDRIAGIMRKVGDVRGDGADALADYAGIVDDALGLAESWAGVFSHLQGHSRDIPDALGELRKTARALAAQQYATAALGAYSLAERIKGFNLKLPAGSARFVSFMTAAAEAQSADEFANVIDAYAAPVQSYRTKRKAKSIYVALNGYLGGSYGGGILGEEKVGHSVRNYGGVTAPVGLELGIGFQGFSFGILGQVLDVGTPASYRMTKDDDALKSEPEVGFAQVFSPGAYFVLGFPCVPITFGAGINIAPQLRKGATGSGDARNARRTGVFLAIDIPILKLM